MAFSLSRGLVLRRGERSFEFERDLGDGRVQFKFLDNYEIQTFKICTLIKDIHERRVKVVTSFVNINASFDEDAQGAQILPQNLTEVQEVQIAFRMHYVKAFERAKVQIGSVSQCKDILAKTNRPQSNDERDAQLFWLFKTPKVHSVMGWIKRYRVTGGSAYALIDRRALAIKPKRLSKDADKIVDECIHQHYLKLRGSSAKATCRFIQRRIEAENKNGANLRSVSDSTVLRRINEIPPFVRDSKRIGMAWAKNKWRFSLAGDQSTRVLERAEIDHTLLDIWVLDPLSGVPLGRPWISVVIDRMSGYILGIYVSFYGPSAATVANVVKNSIRPKSELIQKIPGITVPWTAMGIAEMYVVDNGLEFHSRLFRRIAWELQCDLIYNPVRQPWLKASIERAMMEFNRMLPAKGKVYAPVKNGQAPDPEKTAAILFDDLCETILFWAVQQFPHHIHPKTLVRPIDLWSEGQTYSAPPIFPLDFAGLDLAAGVGIERTIDGDGVFFQYMRFNSYELQHYARNNGHKFRTEVRVNPDSLAQVHVLLPRLNQWLAVPIQRPSPEYGNGMSLLQHQIIRAEAGKKLTRANAAEVLFKAQISVWDRWGEAIRRGQKVRRDSDLIRMQGYTSAHLNGTPAAVFSSASPVPEASPVMVQNLEKSIPYKTFSLAEEDF